MEEVEIPETLQGIKGAFVSSLIRNNKKIREDRAIVIAESAEMQYKRYVEDLELKIKQLRRDQDSMLDLSPTDAQSLVLASDFDAGKFVSKDVALGLSIRDAEITLEVAKKQYNRLFKG